MVGPSERQAGPSNVVASGAAVLAILGAALLVPAPAGANHTQELLSYGASQWLYKIVPGGVNVLPWSLLGFNNMGNAPFREGAGCPIPAARTAWPANTELFATHLIITPPGSNNVKVLVAIDNDVQISWNGADISGGRVFTENCGDADKLAFNVPQNLVQPGVNRLDAHAWDRGGESFFDARVTATVPIP